MFLPAIFEDCNITISRCNQLHGGDINQAYCLHGDKKYFLKVNDSERYPGMFAKEAAGLSELSGSCSLKVPGIIKYGTVRQQQYLLLEWIEGGNADSDTWENFGAGIARMHQRSQPYFGWKEDNYIGSLPQINRQHDSWPVFFTLCRIMPLVRLSFDKGSFTQTDVVHAEKVCQKLDQLFTTEPPSLLHGDLWSGNFMITDTGNVSIYDPAVYYGHREMDIGMTQLFGGFDEHFYQSYNDVYPLEHGWQGRLPLTQLYPLLVHAVLFGGHYIDAARAIIRNFS